MSCPSWADGAGSRGAGTVLYRTFPMPTLAGVLLCKTLCGRGNRANFTEKKAFRQKLVAGFVAEREQNLPADTAGCCLREPSLSSPLARELGGFVLRRCVPAAFVLSLLLVWNISGAVGPSCGKRQAWEQLCCWRYWGSAKLGTGCCFPSLAGCASRRVSFSRLSSQRLAIR